MTSQSPQRYRFPTALHSTSFPFPSRSIRPCYPHHEDHPATRLRHQFPLVHTKRLPYRSHSAVQQRPLGTRNRHLLPPPTVSKAAPRNLGCTSRLPRRSPFAFHSEAVYIESAAWSSVPTCHPWLPKLLFTFGTPSAGCVRCVLCPSPSR